MLLQSLFTGNLVFQAASFWHWTLLALVVDTFNTCIVLKSKQRAKAELLLHIVSWLRREGACLELLFLQASCECLF